MKKTGYLTAALLLFAQPAFAMLPLTPATIQAAQVYGTERKGASLGELLEAAEPLRAPGTGGGLYPLPDRRRGRPADRRRRRHPQRAPGNEGGQTV